MANRIARSPGAVLVFGAALAFYSATLAPTVLWGDSAWLSTDAFQGTLHLGRAVNHPLFVLVGHLFSTLPGDVARNVNFAAAFFGALSVMLVYRCARLLDVSRLAAAVGAAALCVSHAFWQHSVVAEVYSANAFFLVAVLNLLLEWKRRAHGGWLLAAAVVFAIGLTNHLVLATAAPAALAFVLATRGRALLSRRWLIGLGAVAALFAGIALFPPAPVEAALRTLWDGPAGISEYLKLELAPPAVLAREAGYYLAYLIYQFPSVTLPLGVIGVFALLRDRRAVAVWLLMTMAVNAGVFIRHAEWPSAGGSKYVFYIADYVLFAILCAVGADEIFRRVAARRRVVGYAVLAAAALVPPLFYAAMPSMAGRAGVDLVRARTLPYRDNDRYFLNPDKHGETGARRFGEEALRAVPAGAVIFADYTPFAVLRYLQEVEQLRPDVQIRTSTAMGGAVHVNWTFDRGRRRPTYLATAAPGDFDFHSLKGEYDLVPAGWMIEVRPR